MSVSVFVCHLLYSSLLKSWKRVSLFLSIKPTTEYLWGEGRQVEEGGHSNQNLSLIKPCFLFQIPNDHQATSSFGQWLVIVEWIWSKGSRKVAKTLIWKQQHSYKLMLYLSLSVEGSAGDIYTHKKTKKFSSNYKQTLKMMKQKWVIYDRN